MDPGDVVKWCSRCSAHTAHRFNSIWSTRYLLLPLVCVAIAVLCLFHGALAIVGLGLLPAAIWVVVRLVSTRVAGVVCQRCTERALAPADSGATPQTRRTTLASLGGLPLRAIRRIIPPLF